MRTSNCTFFSLAACAAVLVSCTSAAERNSAHAKDEAAFLVRYVEGEIQAIESGLPAGAKMIAETTATLPPPFDPAIIRTQIVRARQGTPPLKSASVTFFAFADHEGTILRNDREEDAMAGQKLFALFPTLPKDSDGVRTALGAFPPDPLLPEGDRVFLASTHAGSGTGGGYFMTGWSFRWFAAHLTETVKRDLTDKMPKEAPTRLPILYVGVFDRSGVYFAKSVPATNVRAAETESLFERTQAGAVSGRLQVTDRDFSFAAMRIPKMGEAGLVVLHSGV